jgi:hypothetical protein
LSEARGLKLPRLDMGRKPGDVIRCAECGREQREGERGWQALHGREQPEDVPEVIVFCPHCAEREFGRD